MHSQLTLKHLGSLCFLRVIPNPCFNTPLLRSPFALNRLNVQSAVNFHLLQCKPRNPRAVIQHQMRMNGNRSIKIFPACSLLERIGTRLRAKTKKWNSFNRRIRQTRRQRQNPNPRRTHFRFARRRNTCSRTRSRSSDSNWFSRRCHTQQSAELISNRISGHFQNHSTTRESE